MEEMRFICCTWSCGIHVHNLYLLRRPHQKCRGRGKTRDVVRSNCRDWACTGGLKGRASLGFCKGLKLINSLVNSVGIIGMPCLTGSPFPFFPCPKFLTNRLQATRIHWCYTGTSETFFFVKSSTSTGYKKIIETSWEENSSCMLSNWLDAFNREISFIELHFLDYRLSKWFFSRTVFLHRKTPPPVRLSSSDELNYSTVTKIGYRATNEASF